MIDALLLMMESSPSVTGPMNLGNPQECTIADLAALVVELTGSASKIVHGPRPQDDPMRRMPDIALAERALGWSPQIARDEGLIRTIAYFRRFAEADSEPLRPRLVTALRQPG
jgi:UDP-glucuronate decarboxylase